MYQAHDSVDSLSIDGFDYHDQDLPEPLDHWSLDDFGDLLSQLGRAS